MDGNIIDLRSFLEGTPGREDGVFALWGGDQNRIRLAVPVWRAIFLLGGERGGVVSDPGGTGSLHPFFVLDLGKDPARIEFSSDSIGLLDDQTAPGIAVSPEGGVAVLLGVQEGRRWYLIVAGPKVRQELETRLREEVLFLAGECAGLMFLQDAVKAETVSP